MYLPESQLSGSGRLGGEAVTEAAVLEPRAVPNKNPIETDNKQTAAAGIPKRSDFGARFLLSVHIVSI
jgi:hypothetical protein